jgi:ketosteroid isomerase-like protein
MSRLDYNAVEVQPREIRVTSDTTAYAWGTFTMKLTEKSTRVVTELDGKFCTLLIKTPDGAWKLYRDCFNWIVLQGDAER